MVKGNCLRAHGLQTFHIRRTNKFTPNKRTQTRLQAARRLGGMKRLSSMTKFASKTIEEQFFRLGHGKGHVSHGVGHAREEDDGLGRSRLQAEHVSVS
jgi:hypothetical protein